MPSLRPRHETRQLAHDVRGLLGCVQLEIEALSDYDDERVQRRAEALQLATDRIVDYCRSIMASDRPDPDDRSAGTIEDIVADAASILALSAPDVRLIVHLGDDMTTGLPLKPANAIHRILMNLGRNAMAAVMHQENGVVEIRAERSSSGLRIDVSDNGPGLPIHVLDSLFPRFDRKTSTRGRVGFGLATTQRLADSLGGELMLLKSDCTGARFRVEIPNASLAQTVIPAQWLNAVRSPCFGTAMRAPSPET